MFSAATATAGPPGQYKMLLCAGSVGSNSYGTATNTTSPQNPGGIFSFENYCGQAPDPAGNGAFLRIAENQAGGLAGNGAYGFVYWDTPPYVHYKTAGGWTRQPNAFNDGWRARFWGIDSAGNSFQLFSQGVGAPAGTTSTQVGAHDSGRAALRVPPQVEGMGTPHLGGALPDEVPLVNGEVEWIALRSADLD